MADIDFWKHRYRHAWQGSSEREAAIASRIEEETGRVVRPVGFGATSTEFLSGSADAHGYEKGSADLQVAETNILLEITGTFLADVTADDPLWVRPDKVQHALRHREKFRTWIVHWLEQGPTIRAIPLNQDFFARLDRGAFKTLYKSIRAATETFLEIPARDPCVRTWEFFLEWLKKV